jgi:hypothetical protein
LTAFRRSRSFGIAWTAEESAVSDSSSTRRIRVTSIGFSLLVMAVLIVLTAGSVLAAPGRNNDNAKLCKDWSSLFREDGSTFVDRSDCTSYAAEGGVILATPPTTLPPPLAYQVVVDPPSSTAGTYGAAGASFGPSPTGTSGSLVVVNDGTQNPTEGCSPIIGFPAGAIALVDRGGCDFTVKVANAQAAGAAAVIVANNEPGDPFTMTGSDASITVPAVMVSQNDGATIKAGLPATGSVGPAS